MDAITIQAADQILRDCAHVHGGEQLWPNGEKTHACADCWNRHVAARRAARKAELAARPKDCEGCGRKPHRWTLRGVKFCGRCKTRALQALNRRVYANPLGVLGALIYHPSDDEIRALARAEVRP